MLGKIKKNSHIPFIVGLLLLTIVSFFLLFKGIDNKIQKPITYSLDQKQIELFTSELKDKDPNQVYKTLKLNIQSLSFSAKHDLAHLFGKSLYLAKGNTGISTCDQELSFGCYHGFLSEAINTQGVKVILDLDYYCATQTNGAYTACQHGIGHGLVEYYGRNKISQALDQCQLIQKHLLVGCSSGVFMEYFFPLAGISESDSAPPVDLQKPFALCDPINPLFANSCLYELARLWVVNEKDFGKLSKRCEELVNKEHLSSCLRGLGFASGNSFDPDPDFSSQVCNAIENRQHALYCLSGATWFYQTTQNANLDNKQIDSLCKTSALEMECKKISNLHLDKL